VLVPCIESNIKIVFGASDEHRGFVKWEHNYIQNRRKTGVLAEEASDLMKRFFATKGDDI
jgi:tRNA(adenine34) deaminase